MTMKPNSSGTRVCGYGGVYIAVALVWLMVVDKVQLTTTDWIGAAVSLIGVAIIMFGSRPTA